MGFNSAIVILHDRLLDIEANALRFTESLVQVIKEQGLSNAGRRVNIQYGAELFHTGHADEHQAYLVGGNTSKELLPHRLHYAGYTDPNLQEKAVLMALADKLGYRLVRKTRSRDEAKTRSGVPGADRKVSMEDADRG